jgi:hypothetical protein
VRVSTSPSPGWGICSVSIEKLSGVGCPFGRLRRMTERRLSDIGFYPS